MFKFYNFFKKVQSTSVLRMTKDFKNMVKSFQIYKILTSQANKHNLKRWIEKIIVIINGGFPTQ
jgi:hypothetical protein